jgi:pimeloyl-ACP methyl ester carboxylesterase
VSLFALSVVGKVTSLDAPRFRRDVADKGMWRYYDFLLEADSGIYFLQEYDADKIPVLFVHGIGGTPRDFEPLIGALDRERFQPWVFYYPSGARLDGAATLLTQLFVRLRIEYGFERAAVVAHSMGGLVTRQFLLEDYDSNATEVVQTYVTIASPFGGMSSAGAAIERSPVVVHSWRGLAPGSEFLDGLFWIDPTTKTRRRRLPHHIAYHLLFGFRSGGSSESGDGIVPLVSQLRPEAQEEARTERGYDESHTSILRSAAVAARLNEILAE